jgi:hypothetical protein
MVKEIQKVFINRDRFGFLPVKFRNQPNHQLRDYNLQKHFEPPQIGPHWRHNDNWDQFGDGPDHFADN